jgi:hypothetical protein
MPVQESESFNEVPPPCTLRSASRVAPSGPALLFQNHIDPTDINTTACPVSKRRAQRSSTVPRIPSSRPDSALGDGVAGSPEVNQALNGHTSFSSGSPPDLYSAQDEYKALTDHHSSSFFGRSGQRKGTKSPVLSSAVSPTGSMEGSPPQPPQAGEVGADLLALWTQHTSLCHGSRVGFLTNLRGLDRADPLGATQTSAGLVPVPDATGYLAGSAARALLRRTAPLPEPECALQLMQAQATSSGF